MHLNIPTSKELPINELLDNPLPIDRILYEAEAPIVYLTHTKHGQLLLAYLADESTEGTITFLAPFSNRRCVLLEAGQLPVRDALTESWVWFHLSTQDSTKLWVQEPHEIPNEFLPMEGTPLLPEHKSVFRTRALGEHIALGTMPASVVGFVADATRSALKILLDFTYGASTDAGRPQKNYSKLYDLPIQRLACSSFELSFAAPSGDIFISDDLPKIVSKLEQGLVWAACQTDDTILNAESDEERTAILRASLALTPPNSGAISQIEISGAWIKCGRIKLSRDSRRKVKKELHKLNKEKIVTYCGRIGEIDDDKLSFILRDVTVGHNHESAEDCKGLFEESLLDDMRLFYYDGTKIVIAGIERKGLLSVTAVAPENYGNNQIETN